MGMRAKPKFLKYMIIFALIPLVLSIGLTPATSFGNIFGTPKKQMDDGVQNEDVLCRVGFDLMLRPTVDVACVRPTSADKLTGLGWELMDMLHRSSIPRGIIRPACSRADVLSPRRAHANRRAFAPEDA